VRQAAVASAGARDVRDPPTMAAMVHTFPADGPVKFEVDMAAGTVTVVAEPRDDAVVEIAPAGGSQAHKQAADEATVKFSNGHLSVSVAPDVRTRVLRVPPKVLVTARIPEGGRVTVNSATAEVSTRGRLSKVEVNTVSARVDVVVAAGTVVYTDMSKILGRVNVDPEILRVPHRSDASQVVEVNAVRGRVNVTTA
jgi:hypothetical protein